MSDEDLPDPDEPTLQRRLEVARDEFVPAPPPPTVAEVLQATLRRLERHAGSGRVPLLPTESAETVWARQAAARGCPEHRMTMAAAWRPQPFKAVVVVRRALAWSSARSLPHRRQPFVVVLLGPHGVGKSVALAAAVGHSSRRARFATAHTVATVPETDWSAYVELREQLTRVPLLAIDEAGAEYAKRAGPRIALLLHERYDAGLDTIVASNLTVPEFGERYFTLPDIVGSGEKFESRLLREQAGAGLPAFWVVGGDDRRGSIVPDPSSPPTRRT